MSARLAPLYILVAAICFSTSGPFARLAAPANPLWIAALRTAIAAALLFARAPRSTLTSLRASSRHDRFVLLRAGGLLAAHFAFFLYGLSTTSLASAVTLVSLEPVAVVVVAAVFFKEKPTFGAVLGILIATVGAIVVAQGAGAGDHTLWGDLLVIAAVALYGVYAMSGRSLETAIPPDAYAAAVFGAASLSLWLVVLFSQTPFNGTLSSLGWIVALGVIPTLGGHTLVQWAARSAPATLVALVSPGETLGSLVIGAVLLSQSPTSVEIIGAVLVLLGAVFTLFLSRGKH